MKIIAFEGIDKAGKETVTKAIAEALREKGFRVAVGGFPRYHEPTGKKIKEVLLEKQEMDQLAFTKLYEQDRFEAQEEFRIYEEEGYEFLILDRYVMSNLFNKVKGVPIEEILKMQEGLLPADLHIIVDITVTESRRRGQAYEVLDKYEKDIMLLEGVREQLLSYAAIGHYHNNGLVKHVNGEQKPHKVAENVLKIIEETFELVTN